MFVLYFVFLAHLALSAGQPEPDISQYSSGPWDQNENPEYDTYGGSPLVEDNMLPENYTDAGLPTEEQNLPTTPESYLVLGQGSTEVQDSKVWKIVLVTAILLVSLVGSLGTAYYLCVWRGGRIHYQPQRTYA